MAKRSKPTPRKRSVAAYCLIGADHQRSVSRTKEGLKARAEEIFANPKGKITKLLVVKIVGVVETQSPPAILRELDAQDLARFNQVKESRK